MLDRPITHFVVADAGPESQESVVVGEADGKPAVKGYVPLSKHTRCQADQATDTIQVFWEANKMQVI